MALVLVLRLGLWLFTTVTSSAHVTYLVTTLKCVIAIFLSQYLGLY